MMDGLWALWRRPPEETLGLYPGLVVHDDRVTGSITAGRSRVPLWCFVDNVVKEGWGATGQLDELAEVGYSADDLAEFLHDLLEQRGEFARLLLVLAAAERVVRLEWVTDPPPPEWWTRDEWRDAVEERLHSCLSALESAAETSRATNTDESAP